MSKYPSEAEARREIVEIGRRIYQKGFVAANDGNISCLLGRDEALCTPTGVSKGFMEERDLAVVRVSTGETLRMGSLSPSSEIKMHLRVYRENPEVMAVTHAHPPASTAFAIAGISMNQALMSESTVLLGVVPVARYASPGTQEVPDSIAPFCRDYNAVLLSNHGALTWGKSLMEAYFRLESLEAYAEILLKLKMLTDTPRMLSREQVDFLLETREKLGLTGGGRPLCSDSAVNGEDVL